MFLVLLTVFEPLSFGSESDALPIEPPRHPCMQGFKQDQRRVLAPGYSSVQVAQFGVLDSGDSHSPAMLSSDWVLFGKNVRNTNSPLTQRALSFGEKNR